MSATVSTLWAILTTPQLWLAVLLWALSVAGYWALIHVGSRGDAPDRSHWT